MSQFINQYLDNAAEKWQATAWLAALSKPSMLLIIKLLLPLPAKDNVVVAEQQRFGQYFRNYGYASLSAQNLDDYHTAYFASQSVPTPSRQN
ncbi:MAG: hypothetical protein U1E91_02585 [Moraxella sp.]